ncbi:MAG: UDP-glucose 4-epimerase GalE [Candidatus Omnitrophota bacterium]
MFKSRKITKVIAGIVLQVFFFSNFALCGDMNMSPDRVRKSDTLAPHIAIGISSMQQMFADTVYPRWSAGRQQLSVNTGASEKVSTIHTIDNLKQKVKAGKSKGVILVAGGAGYIGGHTDRALMQSGYDIVILDNLVNGRRFVVERNQAYAQDNDKICVFEQADLKNSEDVLKKYKEAGIPIVGTIHFAAYIEVGVSVERPCVYALNNIINTLRLLYAAKKYGVKNIVFSSSAAVYGTQKKMPLEEGRRKHPTSPYGFNKWVMELMIKSFQKLGMSWIALRYFNAAGAASDGALGESHPLPDSHVIRAVFRRFLDGLAAAIFGRDYPTADGTCERDYIHVEDLADAHVRAIEALINGKNQEAINRAYNVGTGEGLSVLEMIGLITKLMGKVVKKFFVREEARRAGDPPALVADSSDIQRNLGWKAMRDPQVIVKSAIKWDISPRQPEEIYEPKPLPNISEYDAYQEIKKVLAEDKLLPLGVKLYIKWKLLWEIRTALKQRYAKAVKLLKAKQKIYADNSDLQKMISANLFLLEKYKWISIADLSLFGKGSAFERMDSLLRFIEKVQWPKLDKLPEDKAEREQYILQDPIVADCKAQEAVKNTFSYDQGHVFDYWLQLSSEGKKELLGCLTVINFEEAFRLYQENVKNKQDIKVDFESLHAPSNMMTAEEALASNQHLMANALRMGKVAVYLLAGGSGTRLDYDHPKGMFESSPLSGASLYQQFADEVRELGNRYEAKIPLLVQTSEGTDEETKVFFANNNDFGIQDSTRFEQQRSFPVFDKDGKFILTTKSSIQIGGFGHGDVTDFVLRKNDVRGWLQDNFGTKYVLMVQVDNPLAVKQLEAMLAAHLKDEQQRAYNAPENAAHISYGLIEKLAPDDRLGNLAETEEGLWQMVEYSEVDQLSEAAKKKIVSDVGSPNILMISLDGLDKLPALSVHVDRGKKVFSMQAEGKVPGDKMETFVFDTRAYGAAVVLPRYSSFAPTKKRERDAAGVLADESRLTAVAVQSYHHAKQLEKKGWIMPDIVVEEVEGKFVQRYSALVEMTPEFSIGQIGSNGFLNPDGGTLFLSGNRTHIGDNCRIEGGLYIDVKKTGGPLVGGVVNIGDNVTFKGNVKITVHGHGVIHIPAGVTVDHDITVFDGEVVTLFNESFEGRRNKEALQFAEMMFKDSASSQAAYEFLKTNKTIINTFAGTLKVELVPDTDRISYSVIISARNKNNDGWQRVGNLPFTYFSSFENGRQMVTFPDANDIVDEKWVGVVEDYLMMFALTFGAFNGVRSQDIVNDSIDRNFLMRLGYDQANKISKAGEKIEVIRFNLREFSALMDRERLTESSVLPQQKKLGRVDDGFEVVDEVKAVFIDIGGVLIAHDFRKQAKNLKQAAGDTKYSVEWIEEQLRDERFLAPYESGVIDTQEFYRRVKALFGWNKLSYEDFVKAYLDIYSPNRDNIAALRRLKYAGYEIYLVTNAGPLVKEFWMETFPEMHNLADGVIASCEVGVMKPVRAIYKGALRVAGIADPRQVIYIDDVYANIIGAELEKMNALKYNRGSDLGNLINTEFTRIITHSTVALQRIKLAVQLISQSI